MIDPLPTIRLRRGRPHHGLRLLALALTAAAGACGGEPSRDAAAAGDTASAAAAADVGMPPGADVWLGELATEGDSLVARGLRNVTARPGYDNQPAFTADGSAFLYTAADSAGRTDTWRYDLAADRSVRVTATDPESEYSPTPIPGGEGFSAVRVEADSTQRLWRFGWSGGDPHVLFPQVAPVGYHAWAGEEWVVMFVLGDPPTLQVAGGESLDVRQIAQNVGRSIQTIPGTDAVSFVQLADSAGGGSHVMRWSDSEGVTPITPALDGGDFHAWTPDRTLLMGLGNEIRAWREGDGTWRTVGRVPEGGTVTRLAVSPDGSHIAVVVEGPGEG